MKKYLICAVLVSFLCKLSASPTDNNFDGFKGRFIEALWRIYPNWASGQGYHKYDDIITIPNDNSRIQEIYFLNSWLDSLKKFPLEKLGENNKTDYYMIDNQLRSLKWGVTEFRQYEWDPSMYNVGEGCANIITEGYDKLNNRLRMLSKRLEWVESYYAAAKKNIRNPTAEHTEIAIKQNLGSIEIFSSLLKDSVAKSTLYDAEKKEIFEKSEKAQAAIKGYADWLSNEVKPTIGPNNRSFRLGKKLYDEKFKFDIQSSLTAEQAYQKAVSRKSEVQSEMIKLSNELWPKYFAGKAKPADPLKMVKMMIDTLSVEHVKPEDFMLSIRKQLPELVDFINKKNLIYIDPKKPLVVRETPQYMQGIAGASISAPGPYDKNGNTYYNVTPLTSYSPAQAESWLREYNKYILQILNIHEAIPGHYTQLVYSNQSPSLIKSLFGNGAMVEGWAVYGERMMLENGYGNNDPAMWLMYYKWHLRTVCNTILDYSVHVLDMSEKDAMNLLVNEAFQQEAEAKGKWRRVSLTQVQLTSYFSGYSDIYSLREDLKKKEGKKFNLKSFHEKFLSYGSAPVLYIRQLMLK